MNKMIPQAAIVALGITLGSTFGLSPLSTAVGQMRGSQHMMHPDRMPMMDQDRWMGQGYSMVRHRYYMRNGVPSEYRGQQNPLPMTPELVRDGAELYAQHCAACHGANGLGDGAAGQALNPPPANLARTIRMPMLGDDYLLWTIAEGGAPFESAMPAFKDILSRDQIWKIIAAMQSGFPAPEAASENQ